MKIGGTHEGIFIDQQVRIPTFMMKYDHTHNYCEIFYLKRGSCVYKVNKKKYHLSEGDLFIVKAGDPHSTCYEGKIESERLVIACDPNCIHEEFLSNHPDIVKTLNTSGKIVLSSSIRKQIESLFNEMLSENNLPDEYSADFLNILVMKFLLIIQRNGIFVYEQMNTSDEISAVIEQSINYIALNYSLPLSLDTISYMFNLCPSYFSKKFKQETGMTFKEYLNHIRLYQASQMLITTDDSITKISMNCGFNSSNYFKDCFRKNYNLSPREYRNLHK